MQFPFQYLFPFLIPTSEASIPFGNLGPNEMVVFLNGFHFLSGNGSAEISANHYCTILSDDFLQCTVYNSNTTPAHLVGIEYIVSTALFETLDYEERQLWHSHGYEVTSGSLIEPGMPASIDLSIMKVLVGTYGKTVHSWRFDEKDNPVPIGVPELVMGYTKDGQICETFIEARDELFGISTTEVRAARTAAGITTPEAVPGADSWKYGYSLSYGIINTTEETKFPVGATCWKREVELERDLKVALYIFVV